MGEWPEVRARFLLREVTERAGHLPLGSVTKDGGVEFRDALAISVWNPGSGSDLYKRVQPGDFVIGLRSFQSGLGRSEIETAVSPAYTVLRPVSPSLYGPFFRHFFKSHHFVSRLENISQGIRQGRTISTEDFYDLQIPLPPEEEQRRIADFLDRETARIDALIAKKQQVVRLLRDRFVAARRQAFARGPDPRIPWLPPMPKQWPIQRLSRVVVNLDGRRVPLNAEERSAMTGTYPYWGANGVVDRVNEYLFDEVLVLIGEDGAPFFEESRDVAFAVDGRIWVNNHIHVLRPIAVQASFLAEYLNTVDYGQMISGSTRDKLTQADLNAIPVPVPPMTEQTEISEVIQRERLRLEAVGDRLRAQIELLRERRQSLITHAVTGQLPVPA